MSPATPEADPWLEVPRGMSTATFAAWERKYDAKVAAVDLARVRAAKEEAVRLETEAEEARKEREKRQWQQRGNKIRGAAVRFRSERKEREDREAKEVKAREREQRQRAAEDAQVWARSHADKLAIARQWRAEADAVEAAERAQSAEARQRIRQQQKAAVSDYLRQRPQAAADARAAQAVAAAAAKRSRIDAMKEAALRGIMDAHHGGPKVKGRRRRKGRKAAKVATSFKSAEGAVDKAVVADLFQLPRPEQVYAQPSIISGTTPLESFSSTHGPPPVASSSPPVIAFAAAAAGPESPTTDPTAAGVRRRGRAKPTALSTATAEAEAAAVALPVLQTMPSPHPYKPAPIARAAKPSGTQRLRDMEKDVFEAADAVRERGPSVRRPPKPAPPSPEKRRGPVSPSLGAYNSLPGSPVKLSRRTPPPPK
mmetsp:Transcript_28919/g.94535  ORF Transcript_28919/g.94535 Transcript_28919/m.94535 type:complete len:426 (+) Transcript_28919:35-1312(+)